MGQAEDGPTQPVSLDEVMGRVCVAYGLSDSQLQTRSRTRLVAEARAVVGWIAVESDSSTLSAVSKRFG